MSEPATSRPAPIRCLLLSPSRIASVQIIELALRGLEEEGAIVYRALFDDDSEPAERRAAVEGADVVILYRCYDPEALAFLRHASSLGLPAVYGTDDDFSRLPPGTPLGRVHHAPANASAYRALLGEADLVWVFTAEMAARMQPHNTRVFVGRLPCPLELLPPQRLDPDADDGRPLTVGYAGRFVHDEDLRVAIRPLLERLDAPGSNLQVELVDCAPLALRDHPRVRLVPYFEELTDFYRYMSQARWTVALAPLADDAFRRGKTNNKYREYAAFGIPGIYSDVPIYAACVRDRETGILVPHSEAGFARGLDTLLGDGTLRRRIRESALADAAETYSLRAMQEELVALLRALVAGAPTPRRKGGGAIWSASQARRRAAAPDVVESLRDAVIDLPRGQPGRAARLTGPLRYWLTCRRPGWRGLDVMIGTHRSRPHGALRLRIRLPDGALLREARVDLEGARDNSWVSFHFDPVEDSQDGRFRIEIDRDDGARTAIDVPLSVYENAPGEASFAEPVRDVVRAVGRAFDLTLGRYRPDTVLHCRTWHRASAGDSLA